MTQMTHGVTHEAGTVGERLAQSPRVREAVRTIVEETRRASALLRGVRPAIGDERVAYEELMRIAGESRGRALYYPYIGSGVGAGPLVELRDGSVKFDMISGIGVHFFGHSDPELLTAAIEASMGDTCMQGHLQMNEDAIRLAETLVQEASRVSRLAHCFLSPGGALANENALKACYQKHMPASRVLCFQDCFMGRTTTMCQLGDTASYRVGQPLNILVDYMPFWNAAAAKRMSAGDQSGATRYIDMCVDHLESYIKRYPKQHACFAFEIVQGEGGFNTAPREFHEALMRVCKAHGIAVWADEIQTFGRTTSMFAFDMLGLGEHIDVCTIGKMSQACATLFTREYNPQPGLLSSTFLGAGAALRVGRRVVERLRDGDYYGEQGRLARHHRAFVEQVRGLVSRRPHWFPPAEGVEGVTGGVGGMMRFTPFGGQMKPIVELCKVMFEEGVIAFYCGHDPYHVRMLPPLGVMQESDWPRVFEVVERSMARVAG